SDIWYLKKDSETNHLNALFWKHFRQLQKEGTETEKIIWWVGFRAFFWDYVFSFVLYCIYAGLRFAGPLFLNRLVAYIDDETEITKAEAYGYAVALGGSQAVATLFLIYSNWIS